MEKDNKTFRVWLLSDTRKFSRTWDAVTPPISEQAASKICSIYNEEYPEKSHVVSDTEPKL